MQPTILRKGCMTPCPVYGNSEKIRAVPLKLGKNFVVQRHLIATDGAPIRRIKSKNHRPPTEFAEGQFLIRRGVEREIRRWCSRTQNLGHKTPFIACSLPVDRQRGVWCDEPLFAHFAP